MNGGRNNRMLQEMIVSIVTATHNSEKTLARTIESVLNQTYSNIEYIIMDGLSVDNTLVIAHSFENAFKTKGIDYRIISEKDKGMYDAINKAIALSRGTIIGNVNSDDYFEHDAVETVVGEYYEEPFDMIYGDLRIIKLSGNRIKHAKIRKFVSTRYWNHPTTFITKETYSKEPYKCQSIYDDCDLMLRLRNKGYRVRVVSKVLSNFSFGGMSTRKNWKETRERIRVRNRVYKENGYGLPYYIDGWIVEIMKYLVG